MGFLLLEPDLTNKFCSELVLCCCSASIGKSIFASYGRVAGPWIGSCDVFLLSICGSSDEGNTTASSFDPSGTRPSSCATARHDVDGRASWQRRNLRPLEEVASLDSCGRSMLGSVSDCRGSAVTIRLGSCASVDSSSGRELLGLRFSSLCTERNSMEHDRQARADRCFR